MIMIGITGFRRAGKNATASILERVYGFKTYGFADALRSMAAAINPIMSLKGAPEAIRLELSGTVGQLHSQQTTEWHYAQLVNFLTYERAKDIPDVRRYLQRLGTEGVRGTFGPNAWVDALARRIEQEKPERVAISDMRFASEVDYVRRNGGILWRVSRPGVGGDDPHPSEAEIPHISVHREIRASNLEQLERLVINSYETAVQPWVAGMRPLEGAGHMDTQRVRDRLEGYVAVFNGFNILGSFGPAEITSHFIDWLEKHYPDEAACTKRAQIRQWIDDALTERAFNEVDDDLHRSRR